MKRKLLNVFVFVMFLSLMIGCGKNTTSQSIETPSGSHDTNDEESKIDTDEKNDDTSAQLIKDVINNTNVKDPEIVDVSDSEKTITFYRNDMKIFGKLYLPEGDGPYPVAILSGGFGASYTTSTYMAEELAQNGIAAVCFDFTGAVSPSKSDGSVTEFSVLTEAADLITVVNSISALSQIDSSQVYLWGHSFGGLVSAYVSTQIPDKINGLILAEPSLQANDQFSELFPEGTEIPDTIQSPLYAGKIFVEDILSFDIYDLIPNYKGNVLILTGTVAPSIGFEGHDYIDRALELFPSAQEVPVEGANHSFNGDTKNIMIQETITFINDNLYFKN